MSQGKLGVGLWNVMMKKNQGGGVNQERAVLCVVPEREEEVQECLQAQASLAAEEGSFSVWCLRERSSSALDQKKNRTTCCVPPILH